MSHAINNGMIIDTNQMNIQARLGWNICVSIYF